VPYGVPVYPAGCPSLPFDFYEGAAVGAMKAREARAWRAAFGR
jgi:hypothetical protein